MAWKLELSGELFKSWNGTAGGPSLFEESWNHD